MLWLYVGAKWLTDLRPRLAAEETFRQDIGADIARSSVRANEAEGWIVVIYYGHHLPQAHEFYSVGKRSLFKGSILNGALVAQKLEKDSPYRSQVRR